MTEKERMISGKLYNSTDKSLVLDRVRARMLADRYNKTRACNFSKRSRLLKKMFSNSEWKTAFFEPSIRIEYGYNITFGENFYMNFDCQLLDVAPITIGSNVMFAPRVVLATPVHPILASERIIQDYPNGNYSLEYAKPIKIGNNVWIASNVTVCGGATIGDNTVIGAGSVVTKDIPANVFACGVPCKVVRELTDADKMHPWETYSKEGGKES